MCERNNILVQPFFWVECCWYRYGCFMKLQKFLRVGVLTVVAVNITVFWDVTCYLVEVTQTFGVTYCLNLCTGRLIWYYFFFYPENVRFLWNAYKFEPAGVTLCARRWSLRSWLIVMSEGPYFLDDAYYIFISKQWQMLWIHMKHLTFHYPPGQHNRKHTHECRSSLK
jgi:hypothetical protein